MTLGSLILLVFGSSQCLLHAVTMEQGGVVAFDVESAELDSQLSQHWREETSIPGFQGSAYYVAKTNSGGTPGRGILAYPFQVTTSGDYQFQQRSFITDNNGGVLPPGSTGGHDNTTVHNDAWVRLVDENGESIPAFGPVPGWSYSGPQSGKGPYPDTRGDNWNKAYMNQLQQWHWQASNQDHAPLALYWALEAGKTYTLQMSSRSAGHAIDSLILWNRSLSTPHGNRVNGGTSNANNTLNDSFFVSGGGVTYSDVAINCGGSPYTAADGTEYIADQLFSGGDTYVTPDFVAGTADPSLFQSERYGNFNYRVPVFNGTYRVVLQFAEVYATSNGARVFDVNVQGVTEVDNLDMYALVGHDTAYEVVVPEVVVDDGILTISGLGLVDNAKLSAFRIESLGASTSFTLINADTDTDIQTIIYGDTINLATLPTGNFNIRANVPDAPSGVIISLSGATTQLDRTETIAPYALWGDAAGDYNPASLNPGQHALSVTPIGGTAFTINFLVVESLEGQPTANAGSDQQVVLPTTTSVLNGSATDNGSIASYAWTQELGPNIASLSGQNTPNLTVSNLTAGTYVMRLTVTDNEGNTATDEARIFVSGSTTTPVEQGGIITFDVESAPIDEQHWRRETSIGGFQGSAYYVAKTTNSGNPGRGILEYPFQVTTSGDYQFQQRSFITNGSGAPMPEGFTNGHNNNTENNDVFVRLVGESGQPIAAYGPVPGWTPDGNANPNADSHPDVIGGDNWYKSYMNILGGWDWQASNQDNGALALYWPLEAGKTYTLQMSARSAGHAIDSLLLWNRALSSAHGDRIRGWTRGDSTINPRNDSLFTSAGGIISDPSRSSFPPFDVSRDLLLAQFDSLPDADDIHSQAALGSMLLHPDLAGVDYYAVLGAIGDQPSSTNDFIDSTTLMNLIYGSQGANTWTFAFDGSRTEGANWNLSVDRIKARVRPILEAGGKVWVQEAGQSDITADWLRELIEDGVSEALIKSSVIVVQHSIWNSEQTNGWDKDHGNHTGDTAYVIEKAQFIRIPDGNGGSDPLFPLTSNPTPDYNLANTGFIPEARSASNPNAQSRAYWQLADDIIEASGFSAPYSSIDEGGIDFSDCVENWWIFNIGTDADTVRKFWDRYVVNVPGSVSGIYFYDAVTGSNSSDFTIDPSHTPLYTIDVERDALQIDTIQYPDASQFGKATVQFDGVSGVYDVTITTIGEEDGESTYNLYINGSIVGSIQNTPTTESFEIQNHVYADVSIQNGDEIRIGSNPHQNFMIPENGGYAWARARWKSLLLSSDEAPVVNQPLLFTPSEDNYLHNGGGDYGAETVVRLDNYDRSRVGYFKFDVNGITRTVESATLTLQVGNDDGSGILSWWLGDSSNWNEVNLSANTPSKAGPALGSVDRVFNSGSSVQIDLTTLLASGGNGTYTLIFELDTQGAANGDTSFWSSEGSVPPVLSVVLVNEPVEHEDLVSWKEQYSISDLDADDDDDGYSNGFEYYFGMNPKASGDARGPRVLPEADYPTLEYTRRIEAGPATYAIWTSHNLETWTQRNVGASASELTQVGDSINNGDGSETHSVRFNTPMSNLQRQLFFRITVND